MNNKWSLSGPGGNNAIDDGMMQEEHSGTTMVGVPFQAAGVLPEVSSDRHGRTLVANEKEGQVADIRDVPANQNMRTSR